MIGRPTVEHLNARERELEDLCAYFQAERDSARLSARRWKISAKRWRRKAEFRAGDIEMARNLAQGLKEKLADAREELDVVAERGCCLCAANKQMSFDSTPAPK